MIQPVFAVMEAAKITRAGAFLKKNLRVFSQVFLMAFRRVAFTENLQFQYYFL
jgi:hypothetical protein